MSVKPSTAKIIREEAEQRTRQGAIVGTVKRAPGLFGSYDLGKILVDAEGREITGLTLQDWNTVQNQLEGHQVTIVPESASL